MCIGTDQSAAILRYRKSYGVTETTAIDEIFRRTPRLSAVIAVSIETSLASSSGFRLLAYSRLYQNPSATKPLLSVQADTLRQLDFNRWRFYFALEKWELPDEAHFSRSGGPLSMSIAGQEVSLTVPSTVLMDCLAGRTSLTEAYPERPGERLLKCIEEGWEVVGCSFEQGSIEQGLSNRVTLVLAPPPERVFHAK